MQTTYEENITVNNISTLKRLALIMISAVLGFAVAIGLPVLLVSHIDFTRLVWATSLYVSIPLCISVIALQIVIHEGLHGLFFKIYGRYVQFGAAWTKIGPVFFATSKGNVFTRWQYIQIALAPQIITVLSLLLVSLFQLPAIIFFLVLMMGAQNLSGGIFDLYAAIKAWQLPRGAMIEDIKDGWKVQIKQEVKYAKTT